MTTIDLAYRDASADAGTGAADELASRLAALDSLRRGLAAPPHDRDPLLWAAHEALRCASLLFEAQGSQAQGSQAQGSQAEGEDSARADLLAAAAAQLRSATTCVHYAQRERAPSREH